jgi:DNA mismatch repair protein MSH4
MSRMLGVEQLVTLCVHLNREENVRLIEYKITQVIYLKHTLELVAPLRELLEPCTSEPFAQYHQVGCVSFWRSLTVTAAGRRATSPK